VAAVETAGQEVMLRLVTVDRVDAGSEVLVIAGAETDDDLISPGPDTVVGRPPSESAVDGVNRDILNDSGRDSCGSNR
jgi:hypothetical protein